MAHDVHQVRKFEHPGVGRKRAKATPKGRQVDPTAAHEIEQLLWRIRQMLGFAVARHQPFERSK